ncbi:two-component sensor histidine kinase, partial [Mycobacterium tuberculosis]
MAPAWSGLTVSPLLHCLVPLLPLGAAVVAPPRAVVSLPARAPALGLVRARPLAAPAWRAARPALGGA